jgi:hypothetical protein
MVSMATFVPVAAVAMAPIWSLPDLLMCNSQNRALPGGWWNLLQIPYDISMAKTNSVQSNTISF